MSKKNQQKPARSKMSALFMLLILIVALAASGLAGYFWLQLKAEKAGEDNQVAAVVKKPREPVVPVYIPLDAFTVSLAPEQDGSERVLYIGLTLRASDANTKALIEGFLPDVRSRLLVMFSNQSSAEIATQPGKDKLLEQIKTEVNKPLFEKQSAKVDEVLLNAFILR